jgi:NDP-sugar pyrophosphorylase family protein
VLACSYRVDDVRSALGEAEHLGVRLRYAIEAEPLGTGGGVRNAADLTGGTVFVLNGDVLTDVDLSAMRAFHEARGSRTTILLTRVSDPRQYGLVETGPDGRLRRFREKPAGDEPITTDTINAGVYLLDAALLARIPGGRMVSIEREFFPALIADGTPAYGWIVEAYWRDIGSPAAYRAAHVDLLTGKARLPLPPPGEPRGAGCWVESSAEIAADVQLASPVVVGAGVVARSGARIGPLAVVGERCRIGKEARVEGAVLWERVEVGAASHVRDCVIGADVHIGADVDIGPGVVLESGAVIPDHTRLTAERG